MSETQLVTALVDAIHKARYGDTAQLEQARRLLNAYVTTAVGAMRAVMYHENPARCELRWPVDESKPDGEMHKCSLPVSHIYQGIPHKCPIDNVTFVKSVEK